MISFTREITIGDCADRIDININYEKATAADILANDKIVSEIISHMRAPTAKERTTSEG